MRHTRRAVLGAAATITTGLAGCAGSGGGEGDDGGGDGAAEPSPTPAEPTPTATATSTPARADETVVVGPDGDLVFDPAELRVDGGATVLWRWDSGGHTVTVERQPDGADWQGTGEQVQSAGFTHSHTFEVAGTYEYVCLPHESAGMVGSVVVGEAEPSTPTPGSSATVRVRSHPDLGEILVDSEGRTLYMFDRDTRGSGASACSGDCVGAWPPLTVEGDPSAGDGVTAALTVFQRDDGTTQVAAGGWPLYNFTRDEGPGDVEGQGVGGVWWVLGPDGTPKRPESTSTPTPEPSATVQVRSHPDIGEILVGLDGRTLYMFDRDTREDGSSVCSGGCAESWPPLTVDGDPTAGDGVTAALTTFERSDDGKQVAANGWPLYYYARDEEPGDVEGQGAGDVWWVLGPDGRPRRSPATPTPSDGGGGGGAY